MIMSARWPVATIGVSMLLGGCAPSLTVPSGYQGDVAVKLTNESSFDSVCSFAMAPVGEAIQGQWMGSTGLALGQSIDFKLKRGTYHARAGSCQGGWKGEETIVRVDGPTQIAVGFGDRPPAGFRQVRIELQNLRDMTPYAGDHASEQSGGSGGAACQPDGATVEKGTECCSSFKSTVDNDNRSIVRCCTQGPGC